MSTDPQRHADGAAADDTCRTQASGCEPRQVPPPPPPASQRTESGRSPAAAAGPALLAGVRSAGGVTVRSGEAAAGRPAGASGPLDLTHQKQPDSGDREALLCSDRCSSWWCEHCGKRKAGVLRRSLLDQSKSWSCPLLLTLTVDREAFDHPADALGRVSTKSLIPRLMKRLGVDRWAWVLEFQTKTGEGWPHWHVLMDVPGGYLDYAEVRRLWWGLWGIGNIDVQRVKGKSACV